jgi:nitrite reductase (NO-forming)
MSRFLILKIAVATTCLVAGVAAGLLLGSPAAATSTARASAAPSQATSVAVTAGKPTEFAFTLSTHQVPAGLVSFKVTNRGKVIHTFKICASTAIRTATACVGTVTKTIQPGASQTVVVKLTKGVHEFICTIPGHANLGMRGLLGVAVKAPTVTATSTTTSTTTTTTQSTTTHTTTTGNPDGCPPGTTIQTAGFGGDGDDDEAGGVSDGDGCI